MSKSLDAAYEKKAIEQGLVINPVFEENKITIQQYEQEVINEIKMLALKDVMTEQVRKAYVEGWEKGMQDAIDIIKNGKMK